MLCCSKVYKRVDKEMFDLSLNLLYAFILDLTIGIILYNISSKKLNTKQFSLFTFLMFILIYSIIFCYQRNILLVPLSTIFMIIFLSILFKKVLYSVAISVATQIIFALSDALTGFTLVFILKFDYVQITENKVVYLLVAIIILLVSYFTCRIPTTLFHKLYYENLVKMTPKHMLITVFLIVMVLISIYLNLIIFKDTDSLPSKKILLLNLFLIIIFAVLLATISYSSAKRMKKIFEQTYKENELIQLKQYMHMLEDNSNDLRKFKHDYINILHILGSYIESGNLDELKIFYDNELMPESEKILTKDLCFTLLQYIKINPLKALISSKIITAQSRDIKVHIEISEDLYELSINLLDICRIIGILFDNAIEAAQLCENGFIDFIIIQKNTITTFVINNSCIDSTPPIYKMYEKNFSTKGPGRGIGLNSIREIIDLNYTNVFLNTSIDHCTFKQELSINN